MQLDLFFGPRPTLAPAPNTLLVGGRAVPLELVRHDRARRYVLRLRPDGTARVTVPRHGSLRAARAFAETQIGWLARQLTRFESRPLPERRWLGGSTIYFRGERVGLLVQQAGERALVRFGDQAAEAPPATADVRLAVETHLRRLAGDELPSRVFQLAAQRELPVTRVSIRNQRSRWGSCSRAGTISLNWRLVQMPDAVRDYVIWHELMHLRVMNHSERFWREVASVCPDFEIARRWLREHGDRLR